MALDWIAGTGTYHGPRNFPVFAVLDEDGGQVLVLWPGAQVGDAATRRTVVLRDDKLVVAAWQGSDGSQLPEIVLREGQQGHWERSGREMYSSAPAWRLFAKPVAPVRTPAIARVLPTAPAPASSDFLAGTALTPPNFGDCATGGGEHEQEAEEAAGDRREPDELKGVVDKIFAQYRVGRGTKGVVLFADDHGVRTIDELIEAFGEDVANRKWELLRELRQDARTVQLVARELTPLPVQGFLVSDSTGYSWRNPETGQDEPFARLKESLSLDLVAAQPYAWPMALNNSELPPLAVVGLLSGAEHVRPRDRHGDLRFLVHCPRRAMRSITVLVETGEPGVLTARGLALLNYRPQLDGDGGVSFDTTMRIRHTPPCVVAYDSKGNPRVFNSF